MKNDARMDHARAPIVGRARALPWPSAPTLAVILTLLLGLLGRTDPVFAHGLYVVPQQAADQVIGVVRYTDDTPAVEVPIEVLTDPGRAVLARGRTDAQGRFAINVVATGPVIVVAEGEEGHRAEAPASPISAATEPLALGAAPGAPGGRAQGVDAAVLRALREDFARLEHRLRLQDLLGAIGYLVGLIGAWAWWSARRRR